MSVRAKMKCTKISITSHHEGVDLKTIELQPVYSNDKDSENAQFYKWTPSGKVEIGVLNPAAAEQFVLGKEYFVDFTPAE